MGTVALGHLPVAMQPFSTPCRHVNPEFAAHRRLSLRAEDNRALGACAQFLGDALVVESGHDEIIPHPAAANYIAAFSNAHSLTYRVIEGADHALSRERWERAYTELLVNWLSEMIKERTCLAASSS